MPEEIVKTPAEQIAPIPPQETSIAVQARQPGHGFVEARMQHGKSLCAAS